MAESVLARIVARTRADLAPRQAARPLAALRGGLARSDRSLAAALRAPRAGLILECKRASPSRGPIRPDLDPAALARDYAAVADAVSVLTDAPFFGGSFADLAAVRAAVPLPVLCKDFVVDPYQVYEARAHGADAILLMLSVLDDDGWRRCAAACAEVGMAPLTEVHAAAELERALALGAPIVGINSRDLRTLAVDHEVVHALAPRVPADRLVVAESGVAGHADLRRLRPHCDACLVGSSVAAARDTAAAVRALAYGRVKVCGLTRAADAAAAHAAGATYGGLVFAPESPRRVGLEQAAAVRAAAPLAWVGVFVNAAATAVGAAARALSLAAVQLHGEEDPAAVAAVRAAVPAGCEVWKAVRVSDRVPRVADTGADRLLVDAHRPGARGGTGATFDWGLLAGHPDLPALVVAGGLTPANAAAADALGAFALDVSSGVEEAPGAKSGALLTDFFAALRGRARSA